MLETPKFKKPIKLFGVEGENVKKDFVFGDMEEVAPEPRKKKKVEEPAIPKMKQKKDHKVREYIEFEEIKQYLNGIARVIVFTSELSSVYQGKIDGKNFAVQQMYEGHVKLGIMNGYARQLDNQGECKVGYWRPITQDQVSAPFGKWAWYNKNGSFKISEDIHLGAPDPALPYAIQVHKYVPNGFKPANQGIPYLDYN